MHEINNNIAHFMGSAHININLMVISFLWGKLAIALKITLMQCPHTQYYLLNNLSFHHSEAVHRVKRTKVKWSSKIVSSYAHCNVSIYVLAETFYERHIIYRLNRTNMIAIIKAKCGTEHVFIMIMMMRWFIWASVLVYFWINSAS